MALPKRLKQRTSHLLGMLTANAIGNVALSIERDSSLKELLLEVSDQSSTHPASRRRAAKDLLRIVKQFRDPQAWHDNRQPIESGRVAEISELLEKLENSANWRFLELRLQCGLFRKVCDHFQQAGAYPGNIDYWSDRINEYWGMLIGTSTAQVSTDLFAESATQEDDSHSFFGGQTKSREVALYEGVRTISGMMEQTERLLESIEDVRRRTAKRPTGYRKIKRPKLTAPFEALEGRIRDGITTLRRLFAISPECTGMPKDRVLRTLRATSLEFDETTNAPKLGKMQTDLGYQALEWLGYNNEWQYKSRKRR